MSFKNMQCFFLWGYMSHIIILKKTKLLYKCIFNSTTIRYILLLMENIYIFLLMRNVRCMSVIFEDDMDHKI